MKSNHIIFAMLPLCLLAVTANATDYWIRSAKVLIVQSSLVPASTAFLTSDTTYCSGQYIIWDGVSPVAPATLDKAVNVKATYSLLLTALASGKTITTILDSISPCHAKDIYINYQ